MIIFRICNYLILLFFLLGPIFADSYIIGKDVRLREKTSTKSKILTLLQNGDSIEILKKEKEPVLIGKYYGYWLRAKFKDKEGYVLSAFVKDVSLTNEKFHLFFEKFYDIVYRGGNSFIRSRFQINENEINFALSRIIFPLKYIKTHVNPRSESSDDYYTYKSKQVSKPSINKKSGKDSSKSLLADIIVCGLSPRPTSFNLNEEANITTNIYFSGRYCSYSWEFILSNNKWYLSSVITR